MAYTQPIDRKNPSCMLFLLDRSGSMSDPVGGGGGKLKANACADAINRLISDLIIKCSKGEGVRYYYDVGVIGYGSDQNGAPQVGPAFAEPLSGRSLVPVTELELSPARVEERMRKVVDDSSQVIEVPTKFPIWFDPMANGNTPMREAFRQATQVMEAWVAQHQGSYPPIVINITDGESTDGDPTPEAQSLTNLSTMDGKVLLFNCHISARETAPVVFPDSEEGLPDTHAKLLFNISSPLPDGIKSAAAAEHYRVGPNARGFAFNADLVELIRFLDIGTKGVVLR